MANSPISVLVIIGLYVGIYSLMVADADTFGLDDPANASINEPDGGVLDALLGVVKSIFGVVKLILGALVFNVDDAPLFVRIPVAIAIIGSLAWSAATLARGA